jgi:hypothetical protein
MMTVEPRVRLERSIKIFLKEIKIFDHELD